MSDAKLVRRREVFRGRVVRLTVDDVDLPNGQRCALEMIHHPGAAAVVPVDENGNVLMVRQYRHATTGWLLEVPAGKLDPGEAPERCAEREVEEETGFRPQTLVPMGWIWTTPGFTDERIWLFMARDLVRSRQTLEQDEVLSVEPMDLDNAIELALTGEIRDAKTVCALVRASRFRDRPPAASSPNKGTSRR